jgi:hypothetical protein
MSVEECSHPIIEKYLTRRGLMCADCLTDADFREYPGFKARLAKRRQRADLALNNFHHRGAEAQMELRIVN